MATLTSLNYKGRVWTCDVHHTIVTHYLNAGEIVYAETTLRMVHPKKGNECKECARLYKETPPINR
jgi:hypothetical protein